MMHARTRRNLVDLMIGEYGEALVKSLIDGIVAKTNVSYTEAADIVLVAWQHSH